MMLLAVGAITIARLIERSRLGYGFATIRDDELAAEASGVPTLRLKLIATTISGALMGMAGAPFPYYIGYPAAVLGVRPRLRRQLDRHAADRRHHELGRPADRRHAARLAAADRDRDDLVGRQSVDRRLSAGGLRHHRAERHRRAGAEIHPASAGRMSAAAGSKPTPGTRAMSSTTTAADADRARRAARNRKSRQALRRLCRAGRHLARGRRPASAWA